MDIELFRKEIMQLGIFRNEHNLYRQREKKGTPGIGHCGVPTLACFMYNSHFTTPILYTQLTMLYVHLRISEMRRRDIFPIVRTSWNNPIALCPRRGNWAHRLSMFPKALSSSSIKILNSSNRSWGMWFMSLLIHPGMTSIIPTAPVVFSPIRTHRKAFFFRAQKRVTHSTNKNLSTE